MYVTRWSESQAGVGFQFNESKSTVTYAGLVGATVAIGRSSPMASLSPDGVVLRRGAGTQGMSSTDADPKLRAVVL